MKVLFLTYIPSPYRVEFFQELGKYCNLTVLFEKGSASHRNSSWKHYEFHNFNGVILPGFENDSIPKAKVLSMIRRGNYDEIIVHNASTATGMLAIQYMKNHGIPYWIESDGGFPKSGKGLKEQIKKHFFSGAKGYFSPGKVNDAYFSVYGADPGKVYRYPFTSLKGEELADAPADDETRNALREKLGMTEKQIVISVGRFSYLGGYGKGYDVLMKAAREIRDTGFYIIGGEPTEEFAEMKERMHLDNVHFVGFKSKTDLKDYYMAADAFVLMTVSDVWGLVINEAMSLGAPIITTDMCGAGVDLVEDGANGYLVSVGDAEALRDRIERIIRDDNLRRKMAQESIRRIRNYTYADSVKAHLAAFRDAKEKKGS